ncbi:MAG TPA: BTAD domain-containing putative transcriptional regulator, partial [Candidatus Dormibacteraeota bacterium]
MIPLHAMGGLCRVGLMGGFRVEVDEQPVPEDRWRHRRGADLVKILALAPGHRLPREQVMEMLWPDFSSEAAGANLRKAIYFARQALGAEAAIGVGGGVVALWPEGRLEVDVDEFERAPSLAGYAGELLPDDRYAEWAEARRERARRLLLEVLRREGRWEQVLEIDRADEDAHRALMRAHLQSGNRTAALRRFETLRGVLRVDLGVGPSQETVALFEQALESGPEPATAEQQTQALIARGLVQWSLQQLEEADALARSARALALASGLSRELGEASTLLGMVAMARGRWAEQFRSDFLETLDQAPGRAEFVFHGHLCLAEVSVYALGSADTLPMVEELMAVAERRGNLAGQALAHLLLGAPARCTGRLAEARAEYARALALYEEMGYGAGQALALIRLAGVAVTDGR